MRFVRPTPVVVVATAVAVMFAVVPFGVVFDGWGWAVPVVGAGLLGAFVAAVLEWTGVRSPWIAAAVGAVTAIAWVFISVARDGFSAGPFAGDPWRDLRDGIFDGWSSLLDDTLPLADDRAALVFVTLLAWLTATIAVHVVGRHQSALGALIAVPVLLSVGVAAALPSGIATAAVGAFTGAALLLLVATSNRVQRERWGLGRVTMLGLVVVTSTGAAGLLGQLALETRPDPLDPRSSRDTEIAALEIPDLLARFSAEIDQPADDPVMLVESVDGTALPALRLRLQVYDDYDGERWRSTTEFESVDAVPSPELLPPGESVALRISESRLDGPWIPVPDRVVSLDVTDLRWNETTQTAIGATAGTYVVSGTAVDGTGLEGTPTARSDVDDAVFGIPADTPEVLRSVAQRETADAADDVSAVAALTSFVHDLGRDETGPPGHSLGRLTADVSNEAPTGAEQLATLHALLVRSLGYPARVVVGYVVTAPEVQVTDLHVWVEVAFEGRGWVAADPAPLFADAVGTVTGDDTTTPSTTLPTDAVIEARALPRELNPDERPDAPVDGSEGLGGWLTLMAVVGVLLAAIGTLIGLRWLRRRRRQRYERPDELVLGAWAELVDRLRENGQRPRLSATIEDVVVMANEIDPEVASAARPLADLAAEALHAPFPPSRAQAKVAWDRLEATEAALVAARGRLVTARRLADPRVLRHRGPVPPPRERVYG